MNPPRTLSLSTEYWFSCFWQYLILNREIVLILIKMTESWAELRQLCLLFSPLLRLTAISNFNWVQRSAETFVWHQQQTVSGLFENDYYESCETRWEPGSRMWISNADFTPRLILELSFDIIVSFLYTILQYYYNTQIHQTIQHI